MRAPGRFCTWLLGPRRFQMAYISLFAVAASLLAGAVMLLLMGRNPLAAYLNLLQGSGLAPKPAYAGRQGMLTDFMGYLDWLTPMVFASLAVAVGNKAGLFNIGISGQMITAGFAASVAVGIGCTLPAPAARLLVVLIGLACGAALGAFTGWLKWRFNINEVVSSIMLNYTAEYVLSFFINTFYVDPVSRQSRLISPAARLTLQGVEAGGMRFVVPLGFALALAAAAAAHFYLERTVPGFELRAVGASRAGARYAGISVGRNIVLAMLISGALAGLAGVTYFLGQYGSIQPGTLPALGFNSIAVALLGNNHPAGCVLASALVTAISKGSTYMSSRQGVELEITSLITGLILLFASCAEIIRLTANRARQAQDEERRRAAGGTGVAPGEERT